MTMIERVREAIRGGCAEFVDSTKYAKAALETISEPSEAMIEAGTARLSELLEAGVESTYVVSEVFKAMLRA